MTAVSCALPQRLTSLEHRLVQPVEDVVEVVVLVEVAVEVVGVVEVVHPDSLEESGFCAMVEVWWFWVAGCDSGYVHMLCTATTVAQCPVS